MRNKVVELKAFLYRRLAPLVTCRFTLEGGGVLALESKHEVASFQDVFCRAFYWNVLGYLRSPDPVVVDCGANCGHFSILVDVCIRAKWGMSSARYLLIEPNPHLLPVIHKNLLDAGIRQRSSVYHGLVGASGGSATLWVDDTSYLGASLWPRRGSKPHAAPVLDLVKLLEDRPADILKVDVEGAEYALLPSIAAILGRTGLLLLEVHPPKGSPTSDKHTLIELIREMGFSVIVEWRAGENLLVAAEGARVLLPETSCH